MSDDFDTDFASPHEWAKMYFDHGLQVVPAYNFGEKEQWKRPALNKWTHLQKQKMSESDVTEWWGEKGIYRNRKNVGVITGYVSGDIFILDFDSYKDANAELWLEEAQNLFNNGKKFDTPTQITGGGGKQLLFRAPPGWTSFTSKNPIMGIDIRGEGGFAMLPPSKHQSGNEYQWAEDYEIWSTDVLEAPIEMCESIDVLFSRAAGSLSQSALATIKTPTPIYKETAFGDIIDGREDKMTRLVCRKIVNLFREDPIMPSEARQEELIRQLWTEYEDEVVPRIKEAGVPKHILLEKEGRGPTLLRQKWRSLIHKWDTKVAQMAAQPRQSDTNEEKMHGFGADEEDVHAAIEDPEFEDDVYDILTYEDLKNMPPAKMLIDGLLVQYGSNFTTGIPGCGKSFIEIGKAISIATGQKHFLGRSVNDHGTIVYVTTEGLNDHYQRVRAYEIEYGVSVKDAPYFVIPNAINLMRSPDKMKLLRTIRKIEKKNGEVKLITFDTVSRLIPGADENSQKDMSLFVEAQGLVQATFKTTTSGVHHLARSGTGSMRGSTVLEGSADGIWVIKREPGQEIGEIWAAKIKCAPDGWTQEFRLKSIDIDGLFSSLVALEAIGEAPKAAGEVFGGKQETGHMWIGRRLPDAMWTIIFNAIDEAVREDYPWSSDPRSTGRYIGDHILRLVHLEMPGAKFVDLDSRAVAKELILAKWLKAYDWKHNRSVKEGLKVSKWPHFIARGSQNEPSQYTNTSES